MISSVTDLKRRTLVESNTMKSFILSTNEGFATPVLDDILIHDYQIANSATLNTILSNFIVNLSGAWQMYWSHDGSNRDSYFKIVTGLDQKSINQLDDNTKLILDIEDDNGTFMARELKYDSEQIELPEGTVQFVNLDTIWYGIARTPVLKDNYCDDNGNPLVDEFGRQIDNEGNLVEDVENTHYRNENGEVVYRDQLKIVDKMNDFNVNPNVFGQNPFDASGMTGLTGVSSFNGVLHKMSRDNNRLEPLNCIVRNLYYKNQLGVGDIGNKLSKSRYIACVGSKLYGLKDIYDVSSGKFTKLELIDLGQAMPNLDQKRYDEDEFEFMSCGFHVVDDIANLFIVFRDREGDQPYHYMFMNENSYDQLYGFTPINQVSVDRLVVDVDRVFRKVQSIKSLGNHTIAMTDYGFWDLEPNKTRSVTYSYHGTKNKTDDVTTHNTGDTTIRASKLVSPQTNLNVNSRVVECQLKDENASASGTNAVVEKIWNLSGNTYSYDSSVNYVKEMKGVYDSAPEKNHPLYGCTDNFAMYNSKDDASQYLVAKLDFDQFKNLLYSNSELVSLFTKWLYDEVVHSTGTYIYGEYYLNLRHGGFIERVNALIHPIAGGKTWNGQQYQAVRGAVQANLTTMNDIVQGKGYSTSMFYAFCKGVNWWSSSCKMGDVYNTTVLENNIKADFNGNVYPNNLKSDYINGILDGVTSSYPLLQYFRTHLESQLGTKLGQPKSLTVGRTNDSVIESAVHDYIRSKNPASLALYEDSASTQKMDSYLKRNQIYMGRDDVQQVMSALHEKEAVTRVVKSALFFREYDTYPELYQVRDLTTLFNVENTEDIGFAKLSKYIGTSGGVNKINVNWGTIKTWLFEVGDNVTELILFKKFVTTQIYRPLYFAHNEYANFTTDSTKYSITTNKQFMPYGESQMHDLILGSDGQVNLSSSGLDDEGKTFTVTGASYNTGSNILEYNIEYDPKECNGNKFVHEDIEYFVVRNNGSTTGTVNQICFNEFQKQMQSAVQKVKIVDNEFTLNGATFKLVEKESGARVLRFMGLAGLDLDGLAVDGSVPKYREEIVDNMFCIEGVWYSIDGTDIKYAKVDDNLLVKLDVKLDENGQSSATYNSLTFTFDNGCENVTVKRHYETKVHHRVASESSEIDSIPIEFNANKTFAWQFANVVQSFILDPEKSETIRKLGNGQLYDGLLKVEASERKMKVCPVNDISAGVVTTRFILKKLVNGEWTEQDLGVVFDKDCFETFNKVVRGNLTSDNVGLINRNDLGDNTNTFVIKSVGMGENAVNSVWVAKKSWDNAIKLQSTGFNLVDDGVFLKYVEDGTDRFRLVGINDDDENAVNRLWRVEIIGTDTKYASYEFDNCVHVIDKDGARYKVNVKSGAVQKLRLPNEMFVSSYDFTTPYNAEVLRNQLLVNLKQTMMNQIIQNILDSKLTSTTPQTIDVGLDSNLGLYLDMFNDLQSIGNYALANGITIQSDERCQMFAEVYKNSLEDIQDSSLFQGNLYRTLQSCINSVFGNSNQVCMVDRRSIQIVKDTPATGDCSFSYTVYFDADLRLTSYAGLFATDDKNKYVIGHCVVKGIESKFTFVPKFTGGNVVYDLTYSITGKSYDFAYDQIIYVDNNGQMGIKAIEPTKDTVTLGSWSSSGGSSLANSSITDERPSNKGNVLLSSTNCNGWFKKVSDKVSGDQVIGHEIKKNRKTVGGVFQYGGKWELRVPAADGAKFVVRGRVGIDGIPYEVQDGDSTLKEVGGNQILNLTDIGGRKMAVGDVMVAKDEINGINGKFDLKTAHQIKHQWNEEQEKTELIDDTCFVMQLKSEAVTKTSPKTATWLSALDDTTGQINKTDGIVNLPSGKTSISLLIFPFGEEQEIEVGEDLTTDSVFSYNFTKEQTKVVDATTGATETEIVADTEFRTIYVSGLQIYENEDGEGNIVTSNNGWIGKPGSVKLNGEGDLQTKGDEIDLEVFDFNSGLPEKNQILKCNKYTISGIGEDDSANKTLKLKVIKQECVVVVNETIAEACIGTGDLENWMFNFNSSNPSNSTLINVVPVKDVEGNVQVYGAGYGLMKYPITSEMERQIYFTISGGNVNSDGRYCPCGVQVIPPDAVATQVGDIFDRYYAHETEIKASKKTVAAFTNVSYDNATYLKSIRDVATNEGYLGLIKRNDAYRLDVPKTMRDDIEELALKQLGLDDSYFTQTLTQLRQFFDQVNAERNQTLDKDDIANMCLVKYNATATFNVFSGDFSSSGLFDHSSATYESCLGEFNDHLWDEFFRDFSLPNISISYSDYTGRDYYKIVKTSYASLEAVTKKRNDTLKTLWNCQGFENSIQTDIFGDDKSSLVRFIGAIRTDVPGSIVGMFVADSICHLFSKSGSKINWYQFVCNRDTLKQYVEAKAVSESEYIFSPQLTQMDFDISNATWLFKFLNRDFTTGNRSDIIEAFAVHCKNEDGSTDMWYVSSLDGYVLSSDNIVDMAYEQHGGVLYVIFDDDNRVYRYVHPQTVKDSRKRILVKKEEADMVIETFISVYMTSSTRRLTGIYLDYSSVFPSEQTWKIVLYGDVDGQKFREDWEEKPGFRDENFQQYNSIIFGDSLFDEEQLKFQNISKNKEMYDILDVNSVDQCYYGLFKDKRDSSGKSYTVFKTATPDGVVQRLPYHIVVPSIYMTADPLYSLFVVAEEDDGKKYLQEISVPDSDIYRGRSVEIQDILAQSDQADVSSGLEVMDAIMTNFKVNSSKSELFILDNVGTGFHKISYTNDFSQASIDKLGDIDKEGTLKWSLWTTFKDTLLEHHLQEMHHGSQTNYFDAVSRKLNQFKDGFNLFSLLPVEFDATQDVGVLPESKVDDTDTMQDHRYDSVQVSTDIMWSEGMVAQKDSNPGIVVCAVSNPATQYDSEQEFVKVQRNPQIVGTEFYDFIYDSEGNTLMDLYQIPFIYRVSTDNTYDLYINVPTTRTKYLNRLAGTLKGDLTTTVRPTDTSTRLNFMNETMANNLDESTTRLRVYIDRKFISVGNVELVEISGNSIPLQIYRDQNVNDGLYDSIAIESRWNGEVVEINDQENDVNKVMLEFECYGTDSQSIHVHGKTLIHHSLDDKRYVFST